MKILLTGGSGLLGTEIRKLDNQILAPTQQDMDIRNREATLEYLKKAAPDIVIHAAAATKPPQHEETPIPGLENNIIGTANVALACNEIDAKLVYTSTDYIYVGDGPHKESEAILPPYRFGWSKLGGEAAVSMLKNFLILRLSFGPVPFPYEKVYKDQWNSKLYVDEMAPIILAAAKSEAVGIMNVGGPRSTLEDYARRTKPEIETIPRPDWAPKDTSLDISRMKEALKIIDEKELLKH